MVNGLFGGGDGSQASPLLVEDAQDFQAILNVASNGFYFLQTNDLDFSEYGETGYNAIGRDTPFTGNYDGNNFSIKNFHVTHNIYASLFGDVLNANIKNVNISNGICTAIRRQEVENGPFISPTGSLLVTGCNGNVTIDNCNVSGTVNSNLFGGSLLVGDSYADNLEISNCKVSGTIKNLEDNTGYAFNSMATILTNIYSGTYTISDCVAENVTLDRPFYAGSLLVGEEYVASGTIRRCGASGVINLSNTRDGGSYFNGIKLQSYSGIVIEDCYADFTINGNFSNPEDSYIGGICSTSFGSQPSSISNCYVALRNNTNVIAEPYFTADTYDSTTDTIENSYYDSELLSSIGNITPSLNPRTTQQMFTRSNFVNWDFENIWRIREGVSYPIFKKKNVVKLKSLRLLEDLLSR